MSLTVVQHASNTATFSSGTSGTVTVTIAAAGAGNCLVACIGGASPSAAGSVSGVTAAGNVENWASAANVADSTNDILSAIWADPATAGGATTVAVTVAFGYTASSIAKYSLLVDVYEVSGAAVAAVVDKTSVSSAGGSGTSWSSGTTAATTVAAEIWFGTVTASINHAITLTGPSSPWTNEAALSTTAGSVTNTELSGYQIVSTTGTAIYNGTSSPSVSWDACVVTLKSAPALSNIAPAAAQPGRAWQRQFQAWRRGRQAQAFGPVTTVISGSVGMAPMAVAGTVNVTPPPGPSATAMPGASWRRQFQPGSRFAALPVQRTAPQAIMMSGSLAMSPMATAGTMPAATFQAIAPAAAQPGPSWRRRYQAWRRGVQFALQPSPVLIGGGMPMAAMGAGGSEVSATIFPAGPLGAKVELLLNGTWVDVTSFVLSRSDVTITRGRADENQQVTPAQCKLLLANRDGRFSPNNPNGLYYPFITRNVQLRVSVIAISAGSQVPYSGYRFWGEVASWAPKWDLSGTDIWVEVTAAGPLRRSSQGQGTIGSAMRRYYTRLTDDTMPYGYWPCEDAKGASEFASALSGVPAMGYTGTPALGSDSSFGGSDPIPSVNSSSWHGQTLAAANPPGSGTLTEQTPGTYSWTCPPGVTSVSIPAGGIIGAGGGGGSYGLTKGGGGGGGGGSTGPASIPVTSGNVYRYVVGAGGSAGSGQGTSGAVGASSSWTGDGPTVVSAPGGAGGIGGDTSTGGAGGAAGPGGYAGGTGAAGSASSTANYSQTLTGTAGASGGGANGGQTTLNWTAPTGVVSPITVSATGAGGGGGGGAQQVSSALYGGSGGGGGASASASVAVSAGTSYTMAAGNGGGGGSSGASGGSGGASSGGSVSAGGGGGATSSGGGTGGTASPSGTSGGTGGPGAHSISGGAMGGGGGGAGPGANGASASGRTPGSGAAGGGGGGWGASFSGAPNSTPGGTGNGSGGGGGGGGETTGGGGSHSGQVGGGGAGGSVSWSWTVNGVPTGGGGGGSGGSGSAGNAGNGSAGAAAVTGGGGGGGQGAPGLTPGGGGGGGYPPPSTGGANVLPGAGAPGQVTFSWTGGAISPVAADIVRFLLDVQAAGGSQPSYSFSINNGVFTASGSAYANGTAVQLSGASLPTGYAANTTYYVVSASGDTFELSATLGGSPIGGTGSTGSGNVAALSQWVIARAATYGTVARLDVVYWAGGNLELIGYASGGSVLFDSGQVAFGANGTPMMVDVELTANNSGGATWTLSAIAPSAGAPIATYTGTVNSVTVGYVSDVYASPNSDVNFASMGQFTAQTYAAPLTTMATIIGGFAGELAADRIGRLCAEEGLTFTLVGNDTDTPQMGAQQDDTLANVLQSCEDMDRGQLYEPRGSFGVAYRTRVSMQGQSPVIILDYSQAELAGTLEPVADDQYTRNDITLTRSQGSSSTATLTSGAMSTAAPPGGVGDYTYTLTVYAYADSQLANLAAWMLTVGTVPDDRFPVICADMTRTEVEALFDEIPALDVGDFIQVVNAPSWLTAQPISQLAWGVTETLNTFVWRIAFNAVPESPYSEGNPPTW